MQKLITSMTQARSFFIRYFPLWPVTLQSFSICTLGDRNSAFTLTHARTPKHELDVPTSIDGSAAGTRARRLGAFHFVLQPLEFVCRRVRRAEFLSHLVNSIIGLSSSMSIVGRALASLWCLAISHAHPANVRTTGR